MRNGECGTVPSYNVQLVTDTTHGLVVNVEATTDAIDYRQLEPALDRCQTTLGRLPKQIVADGDYTNIHAGRRLELSRVRYRDMRYVVDLRHPLQAPCGSDGSS